jgi:hypothetical protein
VRYGVVFTNTALQSQIDQGTAAHPEPAWGPKARIGTRALPLLQIPEDPDGLAEIREIYREMDSPNPTVPAEAPRLIGTVAGSAATSFQDPSPGGGMPDVPGAALTIFAWMRNQDDGKPRPSWKPGFRVRYRYAYVGTNGLESPGRSPWTDYTGSTGYIQPMMRLPKEAVASGMKLKVFRQFDGGPETVLATWHVSGDVLYDETA